MSVEMLAEAKGRVGVGARGSPEGAVRGVSEMKGEKE